MDQAISSIQLPDVMKPYQEAIDLLWTDNMADEDIDPIVTKLEEFVQTNVLRKKFIKTMIMAAIMAKIKNSHIILTIAQKVFQDLSINNNLEDYSSEIQNPNPIFWKDDVDTLVSKDLCKDDIKEAAHYGAVKCFKVLVGKFSEFNDDCCKDAIIGGNLEIIRILDHHLNFATEKNIKCAIKHHRNNILDWIIEKDPKLFNYFI